MSIDKTLVQQKISKIDEYIERIENMHFSEDQFIENVDYQDLLTFRLQQAVEVCIDIVTHIISSLHLQKPDTARSSFAVLSSHKIITNELAHGLALAVSFRNLAVHGYDQFDFKQLFYDYKKDITDIKEFVGQILFFLKNHKEDGNK